MTAVPTTDPAFEAARPRLHAVAYRMTGSVSDADDLCQEAWIRWSSVDPGGVDDAEAYLVTIVTRLALDRLRSAAVRRETYVGPDLPEPVVAGPDARRASRDADPADAAALADSLTFAFLVVLDALGPVERAALLLHDVFGYSFDEVATMLDRSPAAVRQAASRARRRLESERPRLGPPPPDAVAQATLTRLLLAMAAGDVAGVMAELAPDVVQLGDGGPVVRAARRPIVGADRVARLWVNLARRNAHLVPRFAEVNARPGLLLLDGDRTVMVITAELDETAHIRRIWVQLNPEKLAHLA